jgi:hypothetical protein
MSWRLRCGASEPLAVPPAQTYEMRDPRRSFPDARGDKGAEQTPTRQTGLRQLRS